MTVLDPAIEACPNCGSNQLSGDARVHTNVALDGEGGIAWVERSNGAGLALESLRCHECDETLIEDGEIVSEAVTGGEV